MSPFLSLLLSLVLSDSPKPSPRPRQRREARRRFAPRRLHAEALEDRTVPTVSISVANASLNEIGTPSAFIAAGSGGLSSPAGITLGPDGNVYVASAGTNSVIRYTPGGQLLGTFVSQGSGGLAYFAGSALLAFGPDGNLYVPSGSTNQVLEYNGSTGAFLRAFVSAGSGGLTHPRGLTFGPDGNLYVSSYDDSTGLNGILRFQGPSGASPGSPLPSSGETWAGAAFTPIFAPKATDGGGPRQPLFGPDGNFYVDGGNSQEGIARYDGTTGALLGTFVAPGTGNLTAGGVPVPRSDSPMSIGPAAGQRILDLAALLSPLASEGMRPERSDLPDGPLADGTGPAAALATDGTAAWTADDAATAP